MPLNEEKLYQNGHNGTRDEALQRPENRTSPKPIPKPQTDPTATEETQPEAGTIAPVEASQAQDDAAKALDLTVQAKAKALQDAATREANQAAEEIMVGMQAYTATLLQGTEAMVQAKAIIREGLNQAVSVKPVAVDFSNFFHLKPAVQSAIEGGNS